MKKKIIIVLGSLVGLFILVGIIAIATSGESESPPTSEKPMVNQETLKPIATFEGIGDAIISTFTIEGTSNEPLEFEIKWEAEGRLFNFYLSFASVDNPSIAGNYDDTLSGTIPVSFNQPNPFASNAEFAIEVIASRDCNWTIEIWQ